MAVRYSPGRTSGREDRLRRLCELYGPVSMRSKERRSSDRGRIKLVERKLEGGNGWLQAATRNDWNGWSNAIMANTYNCSNHCQCQCVPSGTIVCVFPINDRRWDVEALWRKMVRVHECRRAVSAPASG